MDDLLERAGKSLVDAARQTTDTGGRQRISARARHLRRRRRLTYVLGPTLAVVAAAALFATSLDGSNGASHQVRVGPAGRAQSAPSQIRPVPGPAGWEAVDSDRVRLWVPSTWQANNPDSCPGGQGVVAVDGVPARWDVCPNIIIPELAISPGETTAPGQPSMTVNGYQVFSSAPQIPGAHTYTVPALAATITVNAAVPASVLSTLGPSPEEVILAAAPAPPIPSEWKQLSYQSVHLRIPDAWSVIDAAHAPPCSSPFAATPRAYLGSANQADSCNSGLTIGPAGRPGPIVQEGSDGISLQAGVRPQAADVDTIRTPDGQTVLFFTNRGTDNDTIDLWYHGTSISIGIGANPILARTILDSINYVPGSPDTAALDACPGTVPSNALPTPQFVSAPTSLSIVDATLDPVPASVKPRVTADSVWRAFIAETPPGPDEHPLIMLGYFSAPLPGHTNPNGSVTPLYQHVLAWVIELTLTISPIGACGSQIVAPFNANTGAGMGETIAG